MLSSVVSERKFANNENFYIFHIWAKITFSNDVALNMFPSYTATMFARDCRLVELNLDVHLPAVPAAEHSLVYIPHKICSK